MQTHLREIKRLRRIKGKVEYIIGRTKIPWRAWKIFDYTLSLSTMMKLLVLKSMMILSLFLVCLES